MEGFPWNRLEQRDDNCDDEVWPTKISATLPKTNIAPENKPSKKETNIPTIHFPVLC